MVLGQPVGDEQAVQHLLAGGAVELQEAAVARGQDVVVVGLQGDRRGQAARDIDQHEGRAPAGHGVEHLHGVEQPLAGGGGEHPHAGHRGRAGGGEHGVLGLQGDHAALHLLAFDPAGEGLDDLGLGRDRKGGHIVDPASRAPQAAAPLPVSSLRVMASPPVRPLPLRARR